MIPDTIVVFFRKLEVAVYPRECKCFKKHHSVFSLLDAFSGSKAIEMIISKRIIKPIGVNPFSVFTDLKTKGAVKTV
jgi:hypothetical protein